MLAAGSTAPSTQYNLTTDQTGFSRSVNGAVDIGADEAETGLVGATLTVNSADGTEVPTNVLTLAEAVADQRDTRLFAIDRPAAVPGQPRHGLGTGYDPVRLVARGPDDQPVHGRGELLRPDRAADRRARHDRRSQRRRDDRAGVVDCQPAALRSRPTRPARAGEPDAESGPGLGATGVTGFNNGGGGGGGAGMGGAVLNFGTLTIQSSTLSGNSAQGGAGGLNGAAVAGEYIALQRGASGSGPVPGLAGQAGGFGGGGGGASFAGYGGAGGFGGGGGGNANKQEDVPGYTGAARRPGRWRFAQRRYPGRRWWRGRHRRRHLQRRHRHDHRQPLAGNSAAGGGGSDGGGNGSGLGGAAFFNDNGTVTVSSTSFTGNAANQGAGIANVGDGGSAPIPVHTATLTLAGTTLSDSTAASTDVQEITINGGTATDSGSGNLIEGVPTGATPAGTDHALRRIHQRGLDHGRSGLARPLADHQQAGRPWWPHKT